MHMDVDNDKVVKKRMTRYVIYRVITILLSFGMLFFAVAFGISYSKLETENVALNESATMFKTLLEDKASLYNTLNEKYWSKQAEYSALYRDYNELQSEYDEYKSNAEQSTNSKESVSDENKVYMP